MAKEATVQVRMDSDMKEKVEALYARMGTTFSEAVRIFAAQSLLVVGMPLAMRAYPNKSSAYGRLAKYGNPALREKEGEAFAKAVEEKHRETH